MRYHELYKTTVLPGTLSIQDTARGSAVGQVQFSADWHQCTTTCGKVSDRVEVTSIGRQR